MIKTIYVPVVKKMSQEARFLMQAKGEIDKFQQQAILEREEAESRLDALLEDGWNVIHSQVIDDSHGSFAAFILHRRKKGETNP